MMVKVIAVISFIIVLLSLPTVSSFSSSQKSNERRVRRYASSSTEETSQMTLPLSGKTAFITGSSGGIGKAIASRFAKAGADIILHYNLREEGATRLQEEINNAHKDAISSGRDTPGKCIGIVHADFRDPKNVHKMFQGIVQDNRLDILINNAGIVTKLAVEDDDDDLSVWHETQAVNLHAPLQLMRLFQKYIKSQSKGSSAVIINNSSIHGSRSVEYMQAYAASKAALDSLTRGLALEYAQDGIRVNGIAPGVVPVERTAEVFADKNIVDMWTPHLPVGRLGTVDDIADATLVLASNAWMTGTILTVDGGMTSRANMPFRPRPEP